MPNLGIFMGLGRSMTDQKKHGLHHRTIDYTLKNFLKYFKKVFIFSYFDEKMRLPKNSLIVENRRNIHRFLYTFMLPFVKKKYMAKCDVFLVTHTTDAIPAMITKCFFRKHYVANYAYKYSEFAKIENKKFATLFSPIIEYLGLKFANAVIVQTNELKNYVEDKFKINPKKIHVISNGVDTKVFVPRQKVLDKNNVKLLFVGRLVKQKNPLNLVRGVALSKYKKQISLTMIGIGPLKKKIVALARNTDIKLKTINAVPFSKMVNYYKQADIFILPSYLEGQSNALIEAMSCGLPCIASNINANRSLIVHEKNGILCGHSPQDIAKSIDLLIGNKKLRKEILQNARHTIKKEHDIHILLKKEANLLMGFCK